MSDRDERGARHLASLVELTSRWARQGGLTVLGHLMSAGVAPAPWAHFPPDDARDTARGYRWYYHCHPDRGRHHDEHGHFHLFADIRGAEREAVAHLVAVSVDAYGLPCRLFAPNRWVTDEQLLPATALQSLVCDFELCGPPQLQPVHDWLRHLLQAFLPQITALLNARDQRLVELKARHGDRVLEDRRIAVLSRLTVNLATQARYYDQSRAGQTPGPVQVN